MLLVNMRTIIKDQTLSSTVSSSNSIRYRTMDMVESTDSIMRMFAGSGELKSFLEKRSSEKSEYYDFYAKNIHVQYVQASPQVSNIYVFINRNEFVYNSNYIYADESVLTQNGTILLHRTQAQPCGTLSKALRTASIILAVLRR